MSTGNLLNGQPWSAKVPGFVDAQRLRKFVNYEKRRDYPMGLDWPGIFLYIIAYHPTDLVEFPQDFSMR